MGIDKDLPPGEKLVACFRPFLEGLVASDLSPKTIQKHVDNLWALGGEIIRDLHEDPSLKLLQREGRIPVSYDQIWSPDRSLFHSGVGSK